MSRDDCRTSTYHFVLFRPCEPQPSRCCSWSVISLEFSVLNTVRTKMHDGAPSVTHPLMATDGNSSTFTSTTTSYLTETVTESKTSTESETSPLLSQSSQNSSSTSVDSSGSYTTETFTELITRVSYNSAQSTYIPYTTVTYTPTIYYYFTTITSEPASYTCMLDHLERTMRIAQC